MASPRSRYVLPALLAVTMGAFLLLSPVVAEGTEAEVAYRLALRLESQGDDAGARLAYERVLTLDPEHRAARRALGFEEIHGYWLRGDELQRAKGFVRHAGRWMTAVEFAAATRPERETAEQERGESRVLACLALVAREDEPSVRTGRRRLAALPARFRLAPLARALRCEPASLRVFAAESLAHLGDPLAAPALLRRAVVEPDDEARRAAVEALRTIDAPGTINPLGHALWSRNTTVRVRAAEALGRIGDVAAASYLVARWEKRSGAFPRVYFAQVAQFSFIQDFDVEVASTSFIADPIVGVLQEGVVQAVHIHATEQTFSSVERIAYAGALRKISGVDHGHDVAAWRTWLDASENQTSGPASRRR